MLRDQAEALQQDVEDNESPLKPGFQPFHLAGASAPGASADARVFGYRDSEQLAIAAAETWGRTNKPANQRAFLYVHRLFQDSGCVQHLVRKWKAAFDDKQQLHWERCQG